MVHAMMGDSKEVKRVGSAQPKGSLAFAEPCHVDAGRAANDKDKGPDRNVLADPPKISGAIAQKVPNVEPSSRAWGNSTPGSFPFPIACCGSGNDRADLNKPSTGNRVQ